MSSLTSDDIDLPPGVTRDSNNRLRFENRSISAEDVQDMLNSRANDPPVDESFVLEEAIEEADHNADIALGAVQTPADGDLHSLLLQVLGKLDKVQADQLFLQQWAEEKIDIIQENIIALIDTSAQIKIGLNRFKAVTDEMQVGIDAYEYVQETLATFKDISNNNHIRSALYTIKQNQLG